MRISGRTVRLLSRCVAVAVVFSALTCWSDDLEFERGRMREMLRIVSSEIQKNFYDPQLKGLNWAALTDEARQKIDKATTPTRC